MALPGDAYSTYMPCHEIHDRLKKTFLNPEKVLSHRYNFGTIRGPQAQEQVHEGDVFQDLKTLHLDRLYSEAFYSAYLYGKDRD